MRGGGPANPIQCVLRSMCQVPKRKPMQTERSQDSFGFQAACEKRGLPMIRTNHRGSASARSAKRVP